ncbi:hypothetical protein EDD36DRAFT_203687 [Exophiala viscosa]|uniref:Uncharacterized protein n=1 Tax=Exophiala viscosa TaxID=2486360 RepID=A0AAN6DWT1_9EURO|nr:hypothetical protein EDD36DRAFT_203687 [Exophiala viscosa]
MAIDRPALNCFASLFSKGRVKSAIQWPSSVGGCQAIGDPQIQRTCKSGLTGHMPDKGPNLSFEAPAHIWSSNHHSILPHFMVIESCIRCRLLTYRIGLELFNDFSRDPFDQPAHCSKTCKCPPPPCRLANPQMAHPDADAIFIDTTLLQHVLPLSLIRSFSQRIVSIISILLEPIRNHNLPAYTGSPQSKYSSFQGLRLFHVHSYTTSSANVAVNSFKADRCPRCCSLTSSTTS